MKLSETSGIPPNFAKTIETFWKYLKLLENLRNPYQTLCKLHFFQLQFNCKLIGTENVDIVNGISVPSAPGNCQSKNCIYLCMCKLCHKPYFGRTVQWINRRMCGHRESFYKVPDNEDIDETSDDYSLGLHLADFTKLYSL